jgi:Zn-dependent protease with chaperone function
MTLGRFRTLMAAGLIVSMPAWAASALVAQTDFRPGFNLFSTDQDLEIGRRSSLEVEGQLPILHDRPAEAYIGAIGVRLAAVLPGPRFHYRFSIVNDSEINAFALPGGYVYVNRGMIEAARSEGQLAGVMAHVMSHAALRHGTNQASKAYLGRSGLGSLGGRMGRDDRSFNRMLDAVGGAGLNPLFMTYSRTDEEQADIVGAQTAARAGYNPQEMIDFFEGLQTRRLREPGRLEAFFGGHPPALDRSNRIRGEMATVRFHPIPPIGGFRQVRGTLLAMPAGLSTRQPPADALPPPHDPPPPPHGPPPPPQPEEYPGGGTGQLVIEPPSSTFRTFEQRDRAFRIDYPSNWRAYESPDGPGVTLAPEGGVVDASGDENGLIYGVVVNHYAPFLNDADTRENRFSSPAGPRRPGGRMDSRTDLSEATDDLLGQIVRTNPTLRVDPDSKRIDTIDGASTLSLGLSGRSPLTGGEEHVTLFTRDLPDGHVVYALFIAPGRDDARLKGTFSRMMESLRVNDRASHP